MWALSFSSVAIDTVSTPASDVITDLALLEERLLTQI